MEKLDSPVGFILFVLVVICLVMTVEGWIKRRRIKAKDCTTISYKETLDVNGNCRKCGGKSDKCGWLREDY